MLETKSRKSYAIKRLLLSFLPNEIPGILLKSLVQNMECNVEIKW